MSKSLAYGYMLCVATLVAMIALARGAVPKLDGFTVFFYVSLIGLLMLPAAFLCFRGAALSTGNLRKVLAYGISAVSACIGLVSAIAAILVLAGSAKLG